MKKYYNIFILFMFFGCKSNYQFKDLKISRIEIVKKYNNDTVFLSNNREIEKIIKILNINKREISKFIPNYKLKMYYSDTVINVVVNNRFISVDDGIKLKTRCNLENRIEKYFKSSPDDRRIK